MTLTICGESKTIGLREKYEGVDKELVTIREIKRRNGAVVTEVRIKRGKRDIVLTDGTFTTLTVQDEETGRFLLKVDRRSN